MKVLHIISCLVEADGHSLFCNRLAAELQRKGIVNRILTCPHVDNLPLLAPVHPNVEIQVVQGRTLRVLNIAWVRGLRQFVAREMEQFAPDLVHVHGLWHPLVHAGVRAAVRRRVPVVTSAHGMLTPWALGHHAWRKRLVWQLYQRRDLNAATTFHACSSQEVEDLRRLGLKQPVDIVPVGCDLPSSGQPERLKDRVRMVLFLGRVHYSKGVDQLIEAWAKIEPLVGQGWQLVIAGPDSGGYVEKLRLLAQARGVADSIRFTGAVYGSEKSRLYQAADLFVLPSLSENFGVVVAEALSYGVPVITTKATPWAVLEGGGDGGRWTEDGERFSVKRENALCPSFDHRSPITGQPAAIDRCGWWIDVGAAPLAAALQEAMQLTDADRQTMGRCGAAMVRERYSWERIGLEMARVYEWILVHGDKPDCVQM